MSLAAHAGREVFDNSGDLGSDVQIIHIVRKITVARVGRQALVHLVMMIHEREGVFRITGHFLGLDKFLRNNYKKSSNLSY